MDMHIDIITLFPELLTSPFESSILKRAIESNKVTVDFHNPRNYSQNKQKQVDDYPFGGGAGMVMQIEPIYRCMDHLKSQRSYQEVIYLTPDGEQLDQKMANELSTKSNILLLCGHYKGVDQRVRDHLITREISIGDFVLSGGELAAAVVCDSIIRLIPGVLGDESSALTDSYQDGLLAPPIYTRPASYKGWNVPEILTSGNTPKIEEWRENKALEKTKKRRPDLLNDKE
jgi:tRNA (guanine37-N1)-methyltransferase